MDITFHILIVQSIVVCLDDVTMFSKRRSGHLCHLKKIFESCYKCRIYLNPKKRIFAISKINISGHIIAKSGIKVDPKRVKNITYISFPEQESYIVILRENQFPSQVHLKLCTDSQTATRDNKE